MSDADQNLKFAREAVRHEPAPRGWRGEASPPLPVQLRYAFPYDRKLPYLERLA